jgi:hypothetical protein
MLPIPSFRNQNEVLLIVRLYHLLLIVRLYRMGSVFIAGLGDIICSEYNFGTIWRKPDRGIIFYYNYAKWVQLGIEYEMSMVTGADIGHSLTVQSIYWIYNE